MKADKSLDIGDGEASPSEEEGAELLNPSGGVEKKLDANSEILAVPRWRKLPGSRSGKRETSSDGSEPYDVKRAGSLVASHGVFSFAATEKEESREMLAMSEGNTAVTMDGST